MLAFHKKGTRPGGHPYNLLTCRVLGNWVTWWKYVFPMLFEYLSVSQTVTVEAKEVGDAMHKGNVDFCPAIIYKSVSSQHGG